MYLWKMKLNERRTGGISETVNELCIVHVWTHISNEGTRDRCSCEIACSLSPRSSLSLFVHSASPPWILAPPPRSHAVNVLVCVCFSSTGSRVSGGRTSGQHAALSDVFPTATQGSHWPQEAVFHGSRAGPLARRCSLSGIRVCCLYGWFSIVCCCTHLSSECLMGVEERVRILCWIMYVLLMGMVCCCTCVFMCMLLPWPALKKTVPPSLRIGNNFGILASKPSVFKSTKFLKKYFSVGAFYSYSFYYYVCLVDMLDGTIDGTRL